MAEGPSSGAPRRSSRGWPAALFPTDAATRAGSRHDYYNLVFLGFAPVNNVGAGLGAVRKINARPPRA